MAEERKFKIPCEQAIANLKQRSCEVGKYRPLPPQLKREVK